MWSDFHRRVPMSAAIVSSSVCGCEEGKVNGANLWIFFPPFLSRVDKDRSGVISDSELQQALSNGTYWYAADVPLPVLFLKSLPLFTWSGWRAVRTRTEREWYFYLWVGGVDLFLSLYRRHGDESFQVLLERKHFNCSQSPWNIRNSGNKT